MLTMSIRKDYSLRSIFVLLSALLVVDFSDGFTTTTSSRSAVRAFRHPSSHVISGCIRQQSHLAGSGGSGDDIDVFMSDLRSRVEEVSDSSTQLPLVVLDSMLPRQVLKIQVRNPLFIELIKNRIEQESPRIGMLGNAKLVSGKQVMLKYGVEVEFDSPEVVGETGSIRLALRGTRRFCVVEGTVENAPEGWTQARVEYLDSEKQEEEEVAGYEASGGGDRMSLARAMRKARELTSPNMRMEDNASLVDRWIELARTRERQDGQIDGILDDLGPIPESEQPSERAFWVGALINPIPAMGVAIEVRPALLTAKTAEDRVQIAIDAIFRSIKHMEGSTSEATDDR